MDVFCRVDDQGKVARDGGGEERRMRGCAGGKLFVVKPHQTATKSPAERAIEAARRCGSDNRADDNGERNTVIVNKAKVILWGSVPTELLLMSCFGEVERFQESGRI